MRHVIVASLLVIGSPVVGEDASWVVLSGEEISAALTDRSLEFAQGDWITFQSQGISKHSHDDKVNELRWSVRKGSLCFQKFSSDLWDCWHVVAKKGNTIRFVQGPGQVTDAVYRQETPSVVMNGDEIRAALTDRTLKYATSTQTFYASGKTLYDAGRPSWGYWRVEGDQYCSQWPPSDLWTCYGMTRQGQAVRFVGAQGDITEGVYLNAE